MGSLTPPWADELRARNSKIARKMMSSMSTDSYLGPDLENKTLIIGPPPIYRNGPSLTSPQSPTTNGLWSKKVVDPASAGTGRMASSQSPTSPSTPSSNKTFRVKRQHPTRNTEKLSPIRNDRDSMFDEDASEGKKGFEMTNGGEDLSILEYGPGIVKKLRSRYQSLALRQYNARPSLRRSASLENCLDAVCAEDLAATLESKISSSNSVQTDEGIEVDGIFLTQRGRKLRDSEETGILSGLHEKNGYGGKPVSSGPRGRSSGPDASARRDRMRRARSVDALHRTKREEEILEKFKHVVLPKEEIVIIEVSKPQQDIISSANVFNQDSTSTGGGGEKRFPTRLLLTSNNLRNNTVLDQQTATRVRSLMSPEHELPPHDIVRETARIFEKNQENLSRRIGQALRLSKSHSTTSVVGTTSPPLTPTSPTPTTTNNMNNILQQKTVTAQSTPTSLASSMQPQDKSFSTTKTTSGKQEGNNAAQTNSMANGPSHGQKQVGIIKPTLSNSNCASVTAKITNGEVKLDRVRSPILSPIVFAPHNKPLIQHTQKPPLSPKPIFTSSPKVTVPTPGTGSAPPANSNSVAKALSQESPATSPILFTERDRSISPFKSESPIPRLNVVLDTNRPKSPVISAKSPSGSPTNEDKSDVFMRSSSPFNGRASPFETKESGTRLGNHIARTGSPDGPNKIGELKPKTALATSTSLQNGQGAEQNKEVKREQPPAPPPRTVSPNPAIVETNSNNKVSQLRVHQKQKSSQGANGSMVFNFTTRKQVPDYIEDDGLRKASRAEGNGGSTDEGFNLVDNVDSKPILKFEGANVIINGKSSIQKKPKSQKLNISFNESMTKTYEYPSESSILKEVEEPSNEEDSGPKKPNVVSGSSLGSYTPKVGANAYQLGSYTTNSDGSSGQSKKPGKEDEGNEFIEDYLKPNTESTTWSNEMSADILF